MAEKINQLKKTYQRSLFIFRRDLRLEDNLGLISALEASKEVIACFIFDPAQIENNPYRSDNAIQFLLQSLEDLKAQLERKGGKLFFFSNSPSEIEGLLAETEKIEAIFVNRDYTPFSKKRDQALKSLCDKKSISFIQSNDILLTEPEEILTQAQTPYKVFTSFYNQARQKMVPTPKANSQSNFFKGAIKGELKSEGLFSKILPSQNKELASHGGREEGIKILRAIKNQKDYASQRDFPSLNSTTHLSAHLKFGTVSIREAYHIIASSLGESHPLLRQLYWRDFFTHVAFHFPHVFGNSFYKEYDKIRWENSKEHFKAWCGAKTGFPLVDAGMRELNATGYMHNRVRMVVASFLTKDLHIDWRWGEKYFAQKLLDYDPSLNNGNWQWAASTGCDAQPYFRIFNPTLQQERFDRECLYIKKWIPELKDLPPKAIHSLWKIRPLGIESYPKPIVDHAVESKKAKEYFASLG